MHQPNTSRNSTSSTRYSKHDAPNTTPDHQPTSLIFNSLHKDQGKAYHLMHEKFWKSVKEEVYRHGYDQVSIGEIIAGSAKKTPFFVGLSQLPDRLILSVGLFRIFRACSSSPR